MEKEYLLMTPGPVKMPQNVYESFSQSMIHHRTSQFKSEFKEVLEKLKFVFQTEQPVQILTATGSGAMEAAITNTLSPQDTVVVLSGGKFGERWSKISKAYELNVLEQKIEWGHAASSSDLKNILAKEKNIKAVMCQACETSTGVLNPIQDLAKVTKENSNALFIVDGIMGVGALPLPMDKWEIDILVSGSQKAFRIPTGVSFISLSKKAIQSKGKIPNFYFNLEAEREANKIYQTHFSSAVLHIRALAQVLNDFEKKGLEYHFSYCQNLSNVTLKLGHYLGFESFPQSPSPSVTALKVPEHLDGNLIKTKLENEHNLSIGGGQDHLKGKILRIGHIGDIKKNNLWDVFERLSIVLNELGHHVDVDKLKHLFKETWSFKE